MEQYPIFIEILLLPYLNFEDIVHLSGASKTLRKFANR
jgi:hypothetical protein